MIIARRFLILVLLSLSGFPLLARACPFCSAEQSTLTEELANSDAAVLARLVRPAPPMDEQDAGRVDPSDGMSGFEVVDVLFSDESLAAGDSFEALYFGEPDMDSQYLVRGVGSDPTEWAIPLRLSEAAVDYIKHLSTLPESGPERIAFFKDYLEHEDAKLAQDAYDEFARAPYSDLKGIKDQLDRQSLLAWIEAPKISPSRKRLFLTMLGVCGTPEDIPRLEAMMVSDSRMLVPAAECLAAVSTTVGGPLSMVLIPEAVELDERRKKLGLDALIACYLVLRGPEGLDLIDQRFLSTEEVVGKLPDYSHIYSAVMALRFLGEESDLVPMDRLLRSTRLLLDNPDFADQVIPDLARWEDWTVLERLADMFRQAGQEDTGVQKFVREPIITYLDVAAEQEGEVADLATAALGEIESLDPEAVRRARNLRAFGFLGRATKAPASTADEPPEPAGLSGLGEDPVVLAEDVEGEEFPDPSSFGEDQGDDGESEAGEEEDRSPPVTPENGQPEKGLAVAATDPITPPSTALLITVPALAAVLCFGLFWVILRGGGV